MIAAKKTARIVKPIFISVDPARDTVGQIRHYAKDFHKTFVFLTGTKDMVAAATKAYRVYFSKVSPTSKFDSLQNCGDFCIQCHTFRTLTMPHVLR